MSQENPTNNIDWNDNKIIIITIFIIVIVFALLISLKRDYGKQNYYPEDRPVDIDYNSIF